MGQDKSGTVTQVFSTGLDESHFLILNREKTVFSTNSVKLFHKSVGFN